MEKTYLAEIYDSFLSSISDYSLLESAPEDIEDDLFTYFKKARRKFRKCKQSLNLIEDRDGQRYFGSNIYHTVKEGDTIFSIAKKYKLDIDQLLNMNDLKITDGLETNSKLIVGVDTVVLTDFEIDILTALMLVEYMRPQLIATEVMKQSLSDKDFRIYSQANQLRELNLLYRLLQREAKVMITEYTYVGMTDDVRKQ